MKKKSSSLAAFIQNLARQLRCGFLHKARSEREHIGTEIYNERATQPLHKKIK